jgi:hypothetical protein
VVSTFYSYIYDFQVRPKSFIDMRELYSCRTRLFALAW